MMCLLVATVNWHKSLRFAKKSNIALLPCLFMILLAVLMITLIMLHHILAKFAGLCAWNFENERYKIIKGTSVLSVWEWQKLMSTSKKYQLKKKTEKSQN